MLPRGPNRSAQPLASAASFQDVLQRIRLRLLVVLITVAMMLCFVAVALLNHRAAPIALAGSILVAINGIIWLLVLQRSRARLRRHGYRW